MRSFFSATMLVTGLLFTSSLLADQSERRMERPLFISGLALPGPDGQAKVLTGGRNLSESVSVGASFASLSTRGSAVGPDAHLPSLGIVESNASLVKGTAFVRWFPFKSLPVYVAPVLGASNHGDLDYRFRSLASLRGGGIASDSFTYSVSTGPRAEAGVHVGVSWTFESGFTIGYERGRVYGAASSRRVDLAYDARLVANPTTALTANEAALTFLALRRGEASTYQTQGWLFLGWSFERK